MTWDGKERRTEDLSNMYEQLGELRIRVAHIERTLNEVARIHKDVSEIKQLLQQGKGMAKMLQILFYVVGPIVAAIYWIKDHVR